MWSVLFVTAVLAWPYFARGIVMRPPLLQRTMLWSIHLITATSAYHLYWSVLAKIAVDARLRWSVRATVFCWIASRMRYADLYLLSSIFPDMLQLNTLPVLEIVLHSMFAVACGACGAYAAIRTAQRVDMRAHRVWICILGFSALLAYAICCMAIVGSIWEYNIYYVKSDSGPHVDFQVNQLIRVYTGLNIADWIARVLIACAVLVAPTVTRSKMARTSPTCLVCGYPVPASVNYCSECGWRRTEE